MALPSLAPFLVVLGLGGVALAAACGGGDPASPTFTPGPPADASSDDASTSSSSDPTADGGVAFANCGTSPVTGSIPTDVEAVLSARCQTCHQDPPLNNAPFPLLNYADVHSLFGGAIPKYQEMHALIQPGGSPHMPYGNAPQLTAAQFMTLDGWLLDCAPPGE